MKKIFYALPIEELCARAFEKFGDVTAAATSAEVAGTGYNQSAIRRTMSSLSADRLLRHEGCEVLAFVISILEGELDQETLEIVPTFYGRNDSEEGAIGTVVHERVLTSRGDQIHQCLSDLRVLRGMLQVVRHRLVAERIVNTRFGG